MVTWCIGGSVSFGIHSSVSIRSDDSRSYNRLATERVQRVRAGRCAKKGSGHQGGQAVKLPAPRICDRCGSLIQGVTGKRLNNRKYCPACSPVAYKEQHRKWKHIAAAKAGVVVVKRAPHTTPSHRPQEGGERPVKTYKEGRRCPDCGKSLSSYTKGPRCDTCDRKKRLENLYTAKPEARLHRVSGRTTLEHRKEIA